MREGPAVQELHHDPELAVHEVALEEADDVGVPARLHDADLGHHLLVLLLFVDVDHLDGNRALARLRLGGIHHTVTTAVQK